MTGSADQPMSLPPPCKGCQKPFRFGEQMINFKNDIYCKKCLKCECQKPLGTQYKVDNEAGKIFCPDCHPDTVLCRRCKQRIEEKTFVKCRGMSFHVKCVKCNKCGEEFRKPDYYVLDGEIYCKPCYYENLKLATKENDDRFKPGVGIGYAEPIPGPAEETKTSMTVVRQEKKCCCCSIL